MSIYLTKHEREVRRWFADGGEETLRYAYDLSQDAVVLDLGGYKGQWTSDIHARYRCRVLVFEPVGSFAHGIRERFARNPNIEVYTLALGRSRRRESIGLCDDGSSTYSKTGSIEEIQFEDVLDFFAANRLESVDLMKVNIEGGEYELMPRLIETGMVDRIKNIQIQFHNVLPDAVERMNAIRADLSRTHSPTYQYEFVWENWVRNDT